MTDAESKGRSEGVRNEGRQEGRGEAELVSESKGRQLKV